MLMRKAVIAVVLAAGALVAAAPASAGCWATVGLAQPPAGTAAGESWTAELTILQHGRTPLANAKPTVTIVNGKSGERRTFAASATGDPGRYDAEVVFPSAGQWRYEVNDGFTTMGGEPVPCARTHTFAGVNIDPPSAAAGGGSGGGSAPLLPVAGGLAGLLAAALLFAYVRRRQSARAPAAA
jgi:hypothetical protein